ncbi:nitroreductase family deazaflavin-dependent oxidoreductase [Candidatus Bathyarchaeota archaeon]|nr:MAG: nitroreductase family deazaflavin-dependent oxidoreductase [Candidatus Bathyarchaeota archaeon]
MIPDTVSINGPHMKAGSLKSGLTRETEIELTVTGRESRKLIPRPVWFVLRGTELLLLPVTGTNSQWYKNILQDPNVKITSNGQTLAGKLRPITGKREVAEVIQLFEAKYGPRDVKRYYPNPNAAASLPLD